MVSGFLQSLRNRFQHILPTVRRIWSELNAEGHIQEPFPASVDAHVGFVDLMVFTFFALRWRKKQSKNTAPTLMQLIGLLRFDFIGVISISVNCFIEKKFDMMIDLQFLEICQQFEENQEVAPRDLFEWMLILKPFGH